jgi:predicted nucleotidyltransferase
MAHGPDVAREKGTTTPSSSRYFPCMRNIPDSMDPDVVRAVDARLDRVQEEHGVRVVWAIESGSRAWGFPSPDSDYDCRFLYVRRVEDYLGLRSRRDVIETPLDKVFDVNGWDVRKAFGLMVRGNATVGEWLRSPIVYRGDAVLRDELVALADDVVDRHALTRHYLHVARNNLALLASTGVAKKFFYALRPAVTLRWMRVGEHSAVPPMDLPTLVAQAAVPDDVRAAVDELIGRKARTRELGSMVVPEVLLTFVEQELRTAEADQPAERAQDADETRAQAWTLAEDAFRRLVGAQHLPAGGPPFRRLAGWATMSRRRAKGRAPACRGSCPAPPRRPRGSTPRRCGGSSTAWTSSRTCTACWCCGTAASSPRAGGTRTPPTARTRCSRSARASRRQRSGSPSMRVSSPWTTGCSTCCRTTRPPTRARTCARCAYATC